MSELKNRYDFMLVFDVRDGNPNGDPDAGNLPRVDSETGQGLVTDVCLKRKVRNYIQLTRDGTPGYSIYVKEKAVLGRLQTLAFKELGLDVGTETVVPLPDEFADKLEEVELCEGLTIREGEERLMAVASDADKKDIKNWMKQSFQAKDPILKFISNILKDAKSRKPSSEETESGRQYMCKNYFDIRAFGAVMSLKSAPNCGQVRGPVQLTFARSVDPIVVLEHSITRMAVATEAEAEKQGGDNHTMGRKSTIPYGLYVAYGFVSPALARQTGFSEEDLSVFWESLRMMFEHDHSAARGLMATQKLIIFKHDSEWGNIASNQLFDAVKIVKKTNVVCPRSFSDYTVEINREIIPQGVTLI